MYIFVASRADVEDLEISVTFKKHQQSATACIRITDDNVVENIESFMVRLILPSEEVHKKKLKYGYYQYAMVYIKDSK